MQIKIALRGRTETEFRIAKGIEALACDGAKLAIRQMKNAKSDSILVHMAPDTFLVPIADVIYFMADKKYVSVVTETGVYRIEDSLDRLCLELGDDFVRTHRKYLVRAEAIRAIVAIGVTQYLDVSGVPDPIPVSRREFTEVRKRLRLRAV